VPTRVQWTLWAPHRAEQLGAHRARGAASRSVSRHAEVLGKSTGICGPRFLQRRAADSAGPHIRDTSVVAAWIRNVILVAGYCRGPRSFNGGHGGSRRPRHSTDAYLPGKPHQSAFCGDRGAAGVPAYADVMVRSKQLALGAVR
jgi:hypothetical protein